MDLAWISSFVGADQVFDQLSGPASTFGLKPGATSPLTDSYCARVLDGRLGNVIPNTAANPTAAALDLTHSIGIGSYAGVPIRRVDGTARGMLCCISQGPAVHLSDSEVRTLELVAELLAEIVNSTVADDPPERSISTRVKRTIAEQDFRIVYQPVIDIASGQVVGVEALSRFVGGPNRPNVWFTEATAVGLGIELELATIDAALAGLGDLDASHYLAVNASPETICDPRLTRMLVASEPDRIVVELTEHTAITSYQALCTALDELRHEGIRVAVDDAGAGFSSLAHVLEIRPSLLKIDRSIVNGLQLDPARMALVEAIIDIANRVDATVIAEGIESRADLDCIGSLGITHAQGYFLGRPAALPAVEQAPSAVVTDRPERDHGASTNGVSDRRCELAMAHSPIGMALISPRGAILNANVAFADLIGCPIDDIADVNLCQLLSIDELGGAAMILQDFLDGSRQSYRAEREFQRVDGSLRWADVSIVLIHSDGQPTYFLFQVQDVTMRRTREHALAQLAGTDHLTSVANRSTARRRLDELAAARQHIAVMYCDLRSFKRINDVYGHQTGDHVLRTVASRLCGVVRVGDIVSRWGGDEFVIILPNASPDLVEEIRCRIMTAVARPIDLPHRIETIEPDITVGIATTIHNVDGGIDELVHLADTDMYRQRHMSLTT